MKRSNQSVLNRIGAKVGTVTESAVPNLNTQLSVLDRDASTTFSGLSTKAGGDQQKVLSEPDTETIQSSFAYLRDCLANQTAAVLCCTIALIRQSVLLASQLYRAWVH